MAVRRTSGNGHAIAADLIEPPPPIEPITKKVRVRAAKQVDTSGQRKAQKTRKRPEEERSDDDLRGVSEAEAAPDDQRDEAALVKEISERFRALVRGLGLERMIGALSPREIAEAMRGWLGQLVPAARARTLGALRDVLSSDYLHPGTWKGLVQMIQSSVEASRAARARRARGDYETDDFGLDTEFFHSVRPVTRFLFERWWRVDTTGVLNVPSEGRALMVANHSGVLPFDGAMITEAIWQHHPKPRYARWLFLKWFSSLPFVSILLARSGCALACPENGEYLLERDHLVGVFPEGLKGVGKLFRDRYRLARFGRGGFIRMAMKSRAPIIPVSVVGAEEIYPALAYAEWISKPLGMPMLPITPTFPWLGVLGLIPLPSKWSIHFGRPIRFNEHAPDRADDFLIVSLLAERVRDTIQSQINDQLKLRKGAFWG